MRFWVVGLARLLFLNVQGSNLRSLFLSKFKTPDKREVVLVGGNAANHHGFLVRSTKPCKTKVVILILFTTQLVGSSGFFGLQVYMSHRIKCSWRWKKIQWDESTLMKSR